MLFLQLSLLALLFPGGDNEEAFQKPVSYHIIQISYIYNHSWVQSLGSGWLDELQTHGWESDSGTIIFLWPWSKGNFSDKELMDLEQLFRMYFIGFLREIQNYESTFQLKYPCEVQMTGGCELHSGETATGFLRAAYEGSDFLSFQNNSWVPSPEGGIRAQNICRILNQYEGIKEIVHGLLSDTCPRFILGLLDAGKAYLQRQVRPQAWLSSGPSPGPGRLLLVCHVSGFYPKPVWLTWMRGEQEQPSTHRGDVLPNTDGTWYLRVTLDVAAGETTGLSCRVRHSSLDGQDIVLYWENHSSKGLIFLAVILPMVLLAGLVFWFRKRCSYQNIW
ncbi:T-cell surface glycoprotein CD1a-like [Tamandua tetradactyla]|uniref:T-cell surface glycoprotein CD1a-like n=1 Tax=Tamandua tetradactyla TaxID=48850 RepID=UPI004053F64E